MEWDPLNIRGRRIPRQYCPSKHISMRLKSLIVLLTGYVLETLGDVDLPPPPTCYKTCLSNTLEKFGCSFSDVGLTSFITWWLVGMLLRNNQYKIHRTVDWMCNRKLFPCRPKGRRKLFIPTWIVLIAVIAGACAVLTSGQTTLPPSLASIIPDPTSSSTSAPPNSTTITHDKPTDPPSVTSRYYSTSSSSSARVLDMSTFTTLTTNSYGQVTQTVLPIPLDSSADDTKSPPTHSSTGAMIAGTPPSFTSSDFFSRANTDRQVSWAASSAL